MTHSIHEHLSQVVGKPTELQLRVDPAPAPHGSLGRYSVTGILGSDTGAELLAVRDEDLCRVIAAKVIGGTIDPDVLETFVKEAQVTGQLQHPNIVPVYELGLADNGRIYFTMKRVDGETLGGIVERGDRTAVQLLAVFSKVCDAIEFAHDRGVAHNGIGPASVMVGSFGEVLVMDWSRATLGGDPAPDVRALGELLGSLLQADASWELEAVVRKATASDSAERYESVAKIQADVMAYLDGRTLGAARYTAVQRALKWIGRHRAVVGATAAVLLVTAGVIGWFGWREHRARQAKIDTALRARGGESLQSCWDAVATLDRVLLLAPGDTRLREARRKAGERLGLVAIDNADYTLARQVFANLRTYGATDAEVGVLLSRIDDAKGAAMLRRRDRLKAIIDDIRGGLSRAGRDVGAPLLDDYIYEAVALPDPQTASIVGVELDRLGKKAKASEHAQWTQDERDLAHFCTEVLGRIGLVESVAPLGRWLLALDPRDGDLLAEAGLALCNTRQQTAIGPLLATHDRLGPGSNTWRRIQRRLNRVPEADTRQDSSADTEHAALVKYFRHDYAGAIEMLTLAIRLAPDRASPYHNRGLARRDSGDLDGAIPDLDKAIELAPGSLQTYLVRGLIRLAKKEITRALADFDRAIELDPDYFAGYANRGLAYLEKPDLVRAEADFSRAIALAPTQPGPYLNRANARRRLGRYNEALADFDRGLRLDPEHHAYYYNRARTYAEMGDHGRAIADYDVAIRLQPRHLQSYVNRGISRLNKGDHGGALVDFSQAIRLEPTFAAAWYNRGNARRHRRELDLAIADYGRAIELDPEHASAYHNRGLARRAKGDTKGAIEDYDQAIRLSPRNATYHYHRGNARRKARDPDGAIEDYTLAIRLSPKHASAFNNRALAREDKGDVKGAIVDLGKALEIDPRKANAYSTRGRLHMRLRQYETAVRDFDRAIRLRPSSDALVYLRRGTAHHRLGRTGKAVADFRHYLRLAPPNAPQRKAAMRYIREHGGGE